VVTTADLLPRDLSATGSFQRPVTTTMPTVAPMPAAAMPAATLPVPIPVLPPVPPPVDPEIERRRNEIMAAYLSYRRQDAFDLLGVPEDGAPAQFEAAFLAFARRFAPWALDSAELAEKARDLFLAGARAYAELCDAEPRNTLLYRRKTLREERARKPAASFAITTDLLDSESPYKKGKALRDAGRDREALVLLEFAADCDPQNGVYAAELAYCRFLVSSAHAGRALKELNETLRRDPNCGLAALYAGEIERQAGSAEKAEAHLRRAIKLMSPDRRPIEALKALSTDRKR
jgi:tetratricopeptide (TPR) repeat protein